MNPEMNRREFLTGTFKVLAVAATTPSLLTILESCSEPEVPLEKYEGKLYGLEGKIFMPEARVNDLLKELIDSGDPMLEEIGRRVKNLHFRDDLATLPEIISPSALPIPITRDYSDETSFAEIYAPNDTNDEFLYGTEDKSDSHPFANPAIFGINIGVNSSFDAREPIEESLFLAKEGLTALLFFRLSEEYQYYFDGSKAFRNLDGSMLTDPSLIARAGLKMGSLDISDKNTLFYKIVDLAPVFLMAPSIKHLVEEGKIPKDSDILGGFYIAANLVNADPELGVVVERLADWWVNSNGLTGPKGFTNELMDPKLLEAIDTAHSMIYKN